MSKTEKYAKYYRLDTTSRMLDYLEDDMGGMDIEIQELYRQLKEAVESRLPHWYVIDNRDPGDPDTWDNRPIISRSCVTEDVE